MRQFLKKAIKEAKDELLVDLSAMQQSPAQSASKILAAVWEILEEVRLAKGELNNAEVLRAVREHSRVDLTEVLISIEDVKQKLERHLAATSDEAGLETSLAEIHMELSTVRKELDFSPILEAIEGVKVETSTVPDKSAFDPGISMTFSDSAADQTTVASCHAGGSADSCHAGVSADFCSMLRVLSEAVTEQKEQLLQAMCRNGKGILEEAALGEVRGELGHAAAALREEGLRLRTALYGAENRSGDGLASLREELLDAVHACRQLLESLKPGSGEGAHPDQVLESLGDIRRSMERHNGEEVLHLLREETSRLATSRLRLAEVMVTIQDHRAQGERDLMDGLTAIRDLRSSVKVDMNPVLQGFQQTDTKLSKACTEILVKQESHHLQVLEAVKALSITPSRHRLGA